MSSQEKQFKRLKYVEKHDLFTHVTTALLSFCDFSFLLCSVVNSNTIHIRSHYKFTSVIIASNQQCIHTYAFSTCAISSL